MNPNIGVESKKFNMQGCSDEELGAKVFWSNEEEAQLLTPVNIVGYYLRLIESYLSSIVGFEGITVKPALSKELEEDFGDPFVVVKRGQMEPHNIGILNGNSISSSGIADELTFSQNQPDASFHDSMVYSEMVNMGLSIDVYGYSPAEVEKIGNAIYDLVHALSYDILGKTFNFIIAVNPPVMSPVNIMEKHSEVYALDILLGIVFKDDTILLIRKNLIKYATIIVRENREERIIYRFDQTED